mgnify:CR=1 FL=1
MENDLIKKAFADFNNRKYELLPCPFCHEKSRIVISLEITLRGYRIHCFGCSANLWNRKDQVGAVIKAWNTRGGIQLIK